MVLPREAWNAVYAFCKLWIELGCICCERRSLTHSPPRESVLLQEGLSVAELRSKVVILLIEDWQVLNQLSLRQLHSSFFAKLIHAT